MNPVPSRRPLLGLFGLLVLPSLLPGQQFAATRAGAAWTVQGKDFRAQFDQDGAEFVTDRGARLRFALRGVDCGATPLTLAAPSLRRAGALIALDRGAVSEEYVLAAESMEQRFRFESLPERAELRVRIGVETGLVAGRDGDAIVFQGPGGAIGYGAATAIDARGRTTAMRTTIVDGGLELVVPADFVAAAAMPLLVDPVVHAAQTFFQSGAVAGETDIAYDQLSGQWLAVFQESVGVDQWRLRAQVLSASGAPVGSPTYLHVVGVTNWTKPRIARLGASPTFLVVAEIRQGPNDTWVGGKLLGLSGSTVTLGDSLILCRAGFNGAPAGAFRNPDVGADGGNAPGGRFTVVFEHYEPGNLDVLMRQVGADGTLLGAAPSVIAASAYAERSPRISRSNGNGTSASQTFGVVYERSVSVSSGTVPMRLWLSLVRADGSLRTLLGQTTWMLSDYSSSCCHEFDVSSPTDDVGSVRWLSVVETRSTATQSHDVFAFVFDHQGVGFAPTNLTDLENGPASWRAKAQTNPVVDSDGTRFTVAYQHAYSGTDTDIYASTFARSAQGSLVMHDARASVAASSDLEQAPVLCARRSGGGLPGRHLVAHTRSTGSEILLRAAVYEGLAAGSFSWRATGCGGASMNVAGSAGLAMPITFTQPTAVGPAGFFIGLPADVPLAVCPGCSLGTSAWTSFTGNTWTLVIPNAVGLVGAVLAVQGFEVVPGAPCLDAIRLTHSVDFVLR
jgi:hypothetical protein